MVKMKCSAITKYKWIAIDYYKDPSLELTNTHTKKLSMKSMAQISIVWIHRMRYNYRISRSQYNNNFNDLIRQCAKWCSFNFSVFLLLDSTTTHNWYIICVVFVVFIYIFALDFLFGRSVGRLFLIFMAKINVEFMRKSIKSQNFLFFLLLMMNILTTALDHMLVLQYFLDPSQLFRADIFRIFHSIDNDTCEHVQIIFFLFFSAGEDSFICFRSF